MHNVSQVIWGQIYKIFTTEVPTECLFKFKRPLKTGLSPLNSATTDDTDGKQT